LHAGAKGLGYLEAGWAVGAITGGVIASQLKQISALPLYVTVSSFLSIGHMATPFVAFVLAPRSSK